MLPGPGFGWAGGYDIAGRPIENRADLRATVHALHGLLYAIGAGGPDANKLMKTFLRAMDVLHQKALRATGAAPSRRLSDAPDSIAPVAPDSDSQSSGVTTEATWFVSEFNRLLLRLKYDVLGISSDPVSVSRSHERLTRRAHEWSQAQSLSGLFLGSSDVVDLYDTPLPTLCHFAFAQRHGVSRALDQWAHWEDFIMPDRHWLSRVAGAAQGETRS